MMLLLLFSNSLKTSGHLRLVPFLQVKSSIALIPVLLYCTHAVLEQNLKKEREMGLVHPMGKKLKSIASYNHQ